MLLHPPPHTFSNFSYEWEMKNLSSHLLQHRPREEEEEEPPPRCEWDFSLSALISSTSAASDAIGVVEFDHSGAFLATGGIARKIRIYATEKSLIGTTDEEDGEREGGVRFLDHAAACQFYMSTPAKLSTLKWRPGSGSRILGSGDYDGVVMEYDLETRVPVFERDEHGGRRVWSIDYSHHDPTLGASGSEDGTMQMWDPRCDGGDCLAAVRPNRVSSSPVCCVEFNPFGGQTLAVGCSDRRIYGYDVRRMAEPVFTLDGHQKAVTYTRFLDSNTIISSAIDGTLVMWDTENNRVIRTYKGHSNSRRFVGLSVWRSGGLLSCGSENNQLYVYDKRWGEPVWVRGFEPGGGQARREPGFVSGVCWRQTGEERCMLVAGGSDGVLQAFQGQRK